MILPYSTLDAIAKLDSQSSYDEHWGLWDVGNADEWIQKACPALRELLVGYRELLEQSVSETKKWVEYLTLLQADNFELRRNAAAKPRNSEILQDYPPTIEGCDSAG